MEERIMGSFLRSLVASLACAVISPADAAPPAHSSFPSKAVRIVVAGTPGGTPDTLARLVGAKLSETWKQAVVVENRPGAGGTLAAATVAKAAPDGHTLLMISSALAIAAALQPNLPYDTVRDFTGIIHVGNSTAVVVVPPTIGVKTLNDLIALSDRQRLLYGSAGAGSAMHLNAERLKLAAGLKGVHVGFKGQSECLLELAAGRIHLVVAGLGPALAFIKDSKLVPLAVTTPQRSAVLPDVPTLAEVLPSGWTRVGSQALLAPAGTPRAIINEISKEVTRAVQLPEISSKLQTYDFQVALSTPDEFPAILRKEIDEFARVGKAAGLVAAR
jgi:tripartite-type tricarboxylate transporter receptor subunit TctC